MSTVSFYVAVEKYKGNFKLELVHLFSRQKNFLLNAQMGIKCFIMNYFQQSKRLENRLEKARELDSLIKGWEKIIKNQPAAVDQLRKQYKACFSLMEASTVAERRKLNQVSQRRFQYLSDAAGLSKRLTLINKYLLANEKVSSEDRLLVARYIRVIRGVNNSAKPSAKMQGSLQVSNATEKKSYVQHTGSYGAKIGIFKRILEVLAQLGPVYKPGNELAKLASLSALHDKLERENRTSVQVKDNFDSLQNECVTQGKLLMRICFRLKNHVAAEYGFDSKQYKTIKSVRYV